MAVELMESHTMSFGNPTPGAAVQLPFDLSRGQPILAAMASELEAVGVMRVQQLLSLVPDPRSAENPQRVAEEPALAEYAALRKEVQRAVEGAKAKNAVDFKNYIIAGLQNRRPITLPAITLYHETKLESIPLGQGLIALQLPYGDFFVAIDGETQRLAWQLAAKEYRDALGAVVKVIIHHGKPIAEARQGFYDLNTKEVKPNAAVAIAMDSVDAATRITRKVMETSDILRGKVNLQRRQLRAKDSDLLTISALRTGIVTTILGSPGLQIGTRSVATGTKAGELHPDTDHGALERAVVDVWVAILEQIEEELDPGNRAKTVVWAPAVLAGIGIVAHHAMPHPVRRDDTSEWSVEEVLERLDGVIWERMRPSASEGSPPTSVWAGVAGKFTPSGKFSIGGPKEFGRMVADALENTDSDTGRQVRGQKEAS